MPDQPPAPSPAAEPEPLGPDDYLLTFATVPCRARRDGWTAERQRGFIEALRATGVIAAAAPIVSTWCQLSAARSPVPNPTIAFRNHARAGSYHRGSPISGTRG